MRKSVRWQILFMIIMIKFICIGNIQTFDIALLLRLASIN